MPAPRRKRSYATSVFVNCPFDGEYRPLFRAAVFTIEYCTFHARTALEVDDSGETRAEKLLRIIGESRFGIHDLSRIEVNDEGLPRFNMPYELGLFIGFKAGGAATQKRKVTLILDREPYRYQRYLSDIAGQDIRSHSGDPTALIREVRNWLQSQTNRHLHGCEYIADRYRAFGEEMPILLAELRKSDADLANYHDFHRLVCDWIDSEKAGPV